MSVVARSAGAVLAVAVTATVTAVAMVEERTGTDEAPLLASAGPPPSREAPTRALVAQSMDEFNAPYDGLYHFVRIRYGSGRGGFGGFGRRREPPWAHDWPRAERNFVSIMKETTGVGVLTEGSNVLTLDDPELFRYPISYIVEPGDWNPTEEEVENLGEYLLKGGFLIVDDFRGPRALDNLEFHLSRAVPGINMVELDETSEVFDSFFRVVPEDVVPPYGGQFPRWYGLFEDNDRTKRLMVVINADNDIAEYWEFSDRGYYPIDLSNEAYKLGVNYVVYGLTH